MKKSSSSKKILKNSVDLTFFAAFLFLSGTTLITLLASLSANGEDQVYLKQALVSETSVNIIASVTYYYFITYLNSGKLSLENITPIRYLDWAFTTPLLIISFVLFTGYSSKKGEMLDFIPLIYIIGFNLAMLFFGYLGETGKINFWSGIIFGFTCYAFLMYFLWEKYIKDENEESKIIFYIFAIIWSLYGLSYLLPTKAKNISYNMLDLVSKAGFGVFIWLSMTFENPKQALHTGP